MAGKNGAGNETRTRDFHLGKVVLSTTEISLLNSNLGLEPTSSKHR